MGFIPVMEFVGGYGSYAELEQDPMRLRMVILYLQAKREADNLLRAAQRRS